MAMAGRKKEVTKEMINNLHIFSPEQYMKEYNCSEKYYVALLIKHPKTKNNDLLDFLYRCDVLENNSVKFYSQFLEQEKISNNDKLCDVTHKLELDSSPEEFVELSEIMKECLQKRRAIKNSIEFVDAHAPQIGSFLALKRSVLIESSKNKMYKVRVLVEKFGTTI